MARTIPQIKEEITSVFLGNETIQNLYGVDPKKGFESQFSKISLESILFHIMATCIWTLETLFDRHKQEVTELIDELRPHTLRWYVNKTKAFQYGKAPENPEEEKNIPELLPDSDEYDNTGKTEEDIAKERIIKYAAVVEKNGIVQIKVATGEQGNRTPLDQEQEDALTTYLKKIKDAGVKLKIINEPADSFGIDIDIYYDPQIFNAELRHIDTNEQTVHNAIASFVENLPFNGEYRNSALINTLLTIEGVVLVDLKQTTANGDPITAKNVPGSGYFKIDPDKFNVTPIAYDTVSI